MERTKQLDEFCKMMNQNFLFRVRHPEWKREKLRGFYPLGRMFGNEEMFIRYCLAAFESGKDVHTVKIRGRLQVDFVSR